MDTPLMKRFGHWIGTWRGPCVLGAGGEGVMQMTLEPLFNGQTIRIGTYVFNQHDGGNINCGTGYLAVLPDGRVVDSVYSTLLGFAVLYEEPDDPEALSLSGRLADNRNMNVFLAVVGDEFTLSSRVTEGYAAADERPRTFTRMKRVGHKGLTVRKAADEA